MKSMKSLKNKRIFLNDRFRYFGAGLSSEIESRLLIGDMTRCFMQTQNIVVSVVSSCLIERIPKVVTLEETVKNFKSCSFILISSNNN